jgi:hypothetical protein
LRVDKILQYPGRPHVPADGGAPRADDGRIAFAHSNDALGETVDVSFNLHNASTHVTFILSEEERFELGMRLLMSVGPNYLKARNLNP